MNKGKEFQELIKDSCMIQNIDCTRLKDAGYRGEETDRRFTVSNICDFILFDGSTLLKLEAKHTTGKSIPLTRLKQLPRLLTASQTCLHNVRQGFILRFDEQVLYAHAEDIDKLIGRLNKKSLNINDIKSVGIEVDYFVPTRKRKPRLNLTKMMKEM